MDERQHELMRVGRMANQAEPYLNHRLEELRHQITKNIALEASRQPPDTQRLLVLASKLAAYDELHTKMQSDITRANKGVHKPE